MQIQKSKKSLFIRVFQVGGGLSLMLLATFLLYHPQNSFDFKAAVLRPAPISFNGTTLPIQNVPNWSMLPESQWGADYDTIPTNELMPLPTYDPILLKTPLQQVSGQSDHDIQIRNLKTTYPAVYMGNYKLDNIEYAGGHLAVDIRAPKNTPVYAIGDGVVVKVGNQIDGFGQHIVIEHDNFPSYNDPSQRTTYYSNYCHLGKILVTEGQVVHKGDLIAKSGQTGLASVPHLHFQIDNGLAPWHPYWPFTYQEQVAAHLDYIGAVNAGLGKEKAMEVTINPLIYIQKYMDNTTLHGSADTSNNTGNGNLPVKKPSMPASKTQAGTTTTSSSKSPILKTIPLTNKRNTSWVGDLLSFLRDVRFPMLANIY